MRTFLDNIHQGGRYSAQIASHQAELRREERFTDQKSLSTSSLQTEYLNLERSSVLEKIVKEETLFIKSTFLVEVLITLQKNVSKVSNRQSKHSVLLVICTTQKWKGRLGNV